MIEPGRLRADCAMLERPASRPARFVMMQSPPVVDLLTPPGRGAVAVISCRVDAAILDGGEAARPLCVARDGRPLAGRAINRITFAQWGNEHPEDVVVCRTGDDSFEIHCHGGKAAVDRIRRDLAATGGRGWKRTARQGCLRSEGNPGPAVEGDLITAAWDAVSLATTLRAADLLLHQAMVAWPAQVENAQGADAPRSPGMLQQSLAWAEFGWHLTEPWTVVLCGKPNAGKSSLMNALAGFQRSIVNSTPGTTRDAVTLDVAFDGWPVRLVDTAGLRESVDELESAGIERARSVIAKADLVLQVFDATLEPPDVMAGAIAVANKIDLVPDAESLSADAQRVSALTGAGIEALIRHMVERLIPELPPRELAIPVCGEHLAYFKST